MEVKKMKRLIALSILAAATQWGCEFLGGAATGALATGAGYEYQAHRQTEKLEDDFKAGRISRDEYNDRKRQIERGSILK
jgi:hypothetical protein